MYSVTKPTAINQTPLQMSPNSFVFRGSDMDHWYCWI